VKQHHCPDNPDAVDGWVEGPVVSCPLHGHSGAKQLGYLVGRGDRRKADREVGVVGVDRGTHITGTGRYVTEK
jgi:hypothetical protein